MSDTFIFTVYQIFILCLLLLTVFLICLYFFTQIFRSKNSLIFLSNFIKIQKIGQIVIFQIFLYSFTCSGCSNEATSNSRYINGIVFCLYTICVGTVMKLEFDPRMIRQNMESKLNTDYELMTFLGNFLIVIVFSINGATAVNYGIAGAVVYGRLYMVEDFWDLRSRYLVRIPDYIMLATCICVLTNVLLVSDDQLFFVWAISLIVIAISSILMSIGQNKLQKSAIEDCERASPISIYSFIYELQIGSMETNINQLINNQVSFVYSHMSTCKSESCYLINNKDRILRRIRSMEKERSLASNNNTSKISLHSTVDSAIQHRLQNSVVGKEIDAYLSHLLAEKSGIQVIWLFRYLRKYTHYVRWGGSLKLLKREFEENECYNFLVEYIKDLVQNEENIGDANVTEENYLESKSLYFKEFKSLLMNLDGFLDELREKKPRMNILESKGLMVYMQLQDVQKSFSRIQKYERLDIRSIDFYLEFHQNFLNMQSHLENVIKHLRQKNMVKFQNTLIDESSQPTIGINLADSGRITAINFEAVKIFKYHKVEMNEKTLLSVVYPDLSGQNLKALFEKMQRESCFCMLIDKNKDYIPVFLRGRIKDHNSRKHYYVEIQPLDRLGDEAYVIINNDFRSVLAIPEVVKCHDDSKNFKCEDFVIQIEKRKSDLEKLHIVEIEYEGITFRVSLNRTLHSGFNYLKIAEHKSSDKTDYINTFHRTMRQFSFKYRLDRRRNKFYYAGSPNQYDEDQYENDIKDFLRERQLASLKAANKSMGTPSSSGFRKTYMIQQEQLELSKIGNDLLSFRAPSEMDPKNEITEMSEQRRNYAEGIKSYRLSDDIIYNIELEDDSLLAELFESEEQKQVEINERKERIRVLILMLYGMAIVVVILVFSLVILIYVEKKRKIQQNISEYSKFKSIFIFEIRFYQIACILRDVAHSTIGWVDSLAALFNDIQQSQIQFLFSKQSFTMNFNGKTYNSCLDELCNILLSEIYKVIHTEDTSNIYEMMNLIETTIHPLISLEKNLIKNTFIGNLVEFQNLSTYMGALSIGLIILFVVVITCINNLETSNRKELFADYRLLSDEQLNSLSQRLNKFQVLLDLSEKNDDVDAYNMLEDKCAYGLRHSPKELIISGSPGNLFMAFLILLVCLNCALLGYTIYFSHLTSASIYNNFLLNQSIISTYSESLAKSISDLSPSPEEVQILNDRLNFIQDVKPNYPYSVGFSQYIDQIFFTSICDKQYSGPQVSCDTTGKQQNPFEAGLHYFFNSVYFALIDDFASVHASMGMNAANLTRVFVYITDKTNREMQAILTVAGNSETSYFVLDVALELVLVIVIGAVFVKSKNDSDNVRRICDIFNFARDTSNDDDSRAYVIEAGQEYARIGTTYE